MLNRRAGLLVDFVSSRPQRSITLTLEMFGGLYKVQIPYSAKDVDQMGRLLFKKVRFNGFGGTVCTEERQYAGRIVFAGFIDGFQVEKTPPSRIESCEIHEIQQVDYDLDQMVRTRGGGTCAGKFPASIAQRLAHRNEHPDLTPREVAVLRMLPDGNSSQMIGDEPDIFLGMVKSHVRNMRK